MTALYYFHHVPESQRIRLALGYKGVPYDAHAVAYHDDETFFNLGFARQVPILQTPAGTLLTDSLRILQTLDDEFPAKPIYRGAIDPAAWDALCHWRAAVDTLLQRLYALAAPAYRGIGDDALALTAYRAAVQTRFGMTLEELANDRYAAFAQLEQGALLKALAQKLARTQFYTGAVSAADMLLAADLFPLQVLDGVSLPIDLMYYIARVEEVCETPLGDSLVAAA